MKILNDLKQAGIDVYLSDDEKLKYRSKRPLNDIGSTLLAELKAHKSDVVEYLKSNRLDAKTALQQAYDGTLKRAVLIECKPEYQALWRGPVWLCPNDDSKAQILKRYPNRLVLTAKEFFDICKIVSESGQAAAMPVIEAARAFGGQIIEEAGK